MVEAVDFITELVYRSSQMDIKCESSYEITVSIVPKIEKISFFPPNKPGTGLNTRVCSRLRCATLLPTPKVWRWWILFLLHLWDFSNFVICAPGSGQPISLQQLAAGGVWISGWGWQWAAGTLCVLPGVRHECTRSPSGIRDWWKALRKGFWKALRENIDLPDGLFKVS